MPKGKEGVSEAYMEELKGRLQLWEIAPELAEDLLDLGRVDLAYNRDGILIEIENQLDPENLTTKIFYNGRGRYARATIAVRGVSFPFTNMVFAEIYGVTQVGVREEGNNKMVEFRSEFGALGQKILTVGESGLIWIKDTVGKP